VTSRKIAHLATGVLAIGSGEHQQGADFIEGKTQLARTANEGQAPNIAGIIKPIPSGAARLARPWRRMASNRGVVPRASPPRPPSRCRYLSSERRWRTALASPPSGGLRAGCRVRKPDDHRFRNGRSLPRRGFGRARFHVRLSVGRDSKSTITCPRGAAPRRLRIPHDERIFRTAEELFYSTASGCFTYQIGAIFQ
jgi:hypothetical protein